MRDYVQDALLHAMTKASQRAWDITQQSIDDFAKVFQDVPRRGIINGVVESDAIVLDDVPALPQPKESEL